jgi:hypothetical protein
MKEVFREEGFKTKEIRNRERIMQLLKHNLRLWTLCSSPRGGEDSKRTLKKE